MSFEIKLNLSSLTGSIDFSSINKPTLLVPCLHDLEEDIVLKIFGALGKYSKEDNKRCPICKELVEGCYPNLPLRKFIEIILGKKQIPIVSVTSKSKDEEKGEKVQFPGIGAKFVYSSGNWKDVDDLAFSFISTARNSFFSAFHLIGHPNGAFSFRLHFDKKDLNKTKEYFFALGIEVRHWEKEFAVIGQKESLRKVFKFLTEENSIPEIKHKLIESALKTFNWWDAPELACMIKNNMEDKD